MPKTTFSIGMIEKRKPALRLLNAIKCIKKIARIEDKKLYLKIDGFLIDTRTSTNAIRHNIKTENKK